MDNGLPTTGLALTTGVGIADVNGDGMADIAACSGLKVETAARQKRSNAPVRATRVDTQQPMFQAARPRHSSRPSGGGGSGDIGLIGLLLAAGAAGLAGATRRKRAR